jgi:hypothetical protein
MNKQALLALAAALGLAIDSNVDKVIEARSPTRPT